MEEDIKILEEFTESSCCLASQEEIIECVKNLIKGYRELEEQIDKHVYFETTNPKEIEKNFIPKSKIKEKIEELEKLKNKLKEEKNEFWIPEINNTIYHIHELMEE